MDVITKQTKERDHLLSGYLKSLSVCPAGIELMTSGTARCSTGPNVSQHVRVQRVVTEILNPSSRKEITALPLCQMVVFHGTVNKIGEETP